MAAAISFRIALVNRNATENGMTEHAMLQWIGTLTPRHVIVLSGAWVTAAALLMLLAFYLWVRPEIKAISGGQFNFVSVRVDRVRLALLLLTPPLLLVVLWVAARARA
jgi:hypothetical protein